MHVVYLMLLSEKGHADVLDIIAVNENLIVKSITFCTEPDRVMYPYWEEYVMEAFCQNFVAIIWCTENIALVVSFELWKRKKVKEMEEAGSKS